MNACFSFLSFGCYQWEASHFSHQCLRFKCYNSYAKEQLSDELEIGELNKYSRRAVPKKHTRRHIVHRKENIIKADFTVSHYHRPVRRPVVIKYSYGHWKSQKLPKFQRCRRDIKNLFLG